MNKNSVWPLGIILLGLVFVLLGLGLNSALTNIVLGCSLVVNVAMVYFLAEVQQTSQRNEQAIKWFAEHIVTSDRDIPKELKNIL